LQLPFDLLKPGGKLFFTVADVADVTYSGIREVMDKSAFADYEISSHYPDNAPRKFVFYECIAIKGREGSIREATASQTSSDDNAYSGDVIWRNVESMVPLITSVIPPDDTPILVDHDMFRHELSRAGRILPFPERDGQFCGLPVDDMQAIRELERLRTFSAGFIVFTWPAFWWLDHYSKFAQYLKSRFSCVMDGELLIIFDLRSSPERDVRQNRSRSSEGPVSNEDNEEPQSFERSEAGALNVRRKPCVAGTCGVVDSKK
jgi:hypothetical protein